MDQNLKPLEALEINHKMNEYKLILDKWRRFLKEQEEDEIPMGGDYEKPEYVPPRLEPDNTSDAELRAGGRLIHSQNCKGKPKDTTVRGLLESGVGGSKWFSSKMRAGIGAVISSTINTGKKSQVSISTKYLHLDSLSVSDGQKVKKGEKIGTLGKSGMFDPNPKNASAIDGFRWCSIGNPHLHFEMWLNGSHKNPMDYIEKSKGISISDPLKGVGNGASKAGSGHGSVNSSRPGHQGVDFGGSNGSDHGVDIFATHDGVIRVINDEEGFVSKISDFFKKNNLTIGALSEGWKVIEGVYLHDSEVAGETETDLPL